jgi:hypothetical protein
LAWVIPKTSNLVGISTVVGRTIVTLNDRRPHVNRCLPIGDQEARDAFKPDGAERYRHLSRLFGAPEVG